MAAVLSCAKENDIPSPSLIVLVSLDTTRSDHIGAYGSEVSTPSIDAFAKEGVVFEQVSSACTTTLPAHVSLLTGVWPTHHGVVRNGYMVNKANEMLPEILQRRGFRTIGVSAAVALSELLDFPQGFDVWDQDPETFAGAEAANRDARRADAITDAAIDHLASVADDSIFLFVHYVDPHTPYDPPEPYRSMYGPVDPGLIGSLEAVRDSRRTHWRAAGETGEVFNNRITRKVVESSSCGPLGVDEQFARLYAGEVSFMDHHLGRLFDALRDRGLYDRALIIVTADHGETFWEHPDCWSHGMAAYETAVRVPLVIRFPGAAHAGLRIGTPISNIDLFPTLLELLALHVDGAVDGRSLLPLLEGEIDERPAFSQGPLPTGPIESEAGRWKNERKAQSVRKGDWKLIRTPYLELEELFDLANDPWEQRNLLREGQGASRPEAAELRAALDAWLDAADPLPSAFYPRRKRGNGSDPNRQAMFERLKALGYISDDDEGN